MDEGQAGAQEPKEEKAKEERAQAGDGEAEPHRVGAAGDETQDAQKKAEKGDPGEGVCEEEDQASSPPAQAVGVYRDPE